MQTYASSSGVCGTNGSIIKFRSLPTDEPIYKVIKQTKNLKPNNNKIISKPEYLCTYVY